jgi:hypothetical protein
VLLKVGSKILVSYELIQNFKISDLAIAKVEKVNTAVTYSCVVGKSWKKNIALALFFKFPYLWLHDVKYVGIKCNKNRPNLCLPFFSLF